MTRERRLELARLILDQPTAPLFEELARAAVRTALSGVDGVALEQDQAGNLVARLDGRGSANEGSPPLVLVAHLDHPGFLVTAVEGDRVELEFRGGLAVSAAAEGSPVELFRRGSPEATGAGRLVSARGENGWLRAATAELAHGEAAGDGFAMWAFPGWSVADGRVVSRACDDLLGVAAAVCALVEVAETASHARPLWGLFTRAEEIGFLGTFEAIRLGTVPRDAWVLSLECSKALPDARQGEGVIVRVGDRLSVFDPAATEALRKAAASVGAERELKHQRKLMDGGACEASAFCAAGYRASGLALPLGNYHNADDAGNGVGAEHVMLDDFHAEVDLLVELGTRPQLLSDESGPPQWFRERAGRARELLAGG